MGICMVLGCLRLFTAQVTRAWLFLEIAISCI